MALFSLLDAVLLRPLPYPEPNRIWILTRGVTLNGVSQVAPMSTNTGAVWKTVRVGATTGQDCTGG
jgi:hypothetical protein